MKRYACSMAEAAQVYQNLHHLRLQLLQLEGLAD